MTGSVGNAAACTKQGWHGTMAHHRHTSKQPVGAACSRWAAAVQLLRPKPHLPQVALVSGGHHHWHLLMQLLLQQSSGTEQVKIIVINMLVRSEACRRPASNTSEAQQMAHHDAQRLGPAAAVNVPLVPVSAPHALLLRCRAPECAQRDQLLRCAAGGTHCCILLPARAAATVAEATAAGQLRRGGGSGSRAARAASICSLHGWMRPGAAGVLTMQTEQLLCRRKPRQQRGSKPHAGGGGGGGGGARAAGRSVGS